MADVARPLGIDEERSYNEFILGLNWVLSPLPTDGGSVQSPRVLVCLWRLKPSRLGGGVYQPSYFTPGQECQAQTNLSSFSRGGGGGEATELVCYTGFFFPPMETNSSWFWGKLTDFSPHKF